MQGEVCEGCQKNEVNEVNEVKEVGNMENPDQFFRSSTFWNKDFKTN